MQLKIERLNKTYGTKQVLFDLNLTANSSSVLGLLGRNGHGKSTTMKILMGVIYADSGQITLDGKPVRSSGVKLGYLPEERGLYQNINIVEQMVYFAKLQGMPGDKAKKSARNLIERLEMTEYLDKKANALSKGNQQKIQLAIALMNDPDVLILDEPFSGLDPVNSRVMQEIIEEAAKNNKLILFSSHQMSQVEDFCVDVCIIKYGKVMLDGNLREIKNTYPKDRLQITAEPGSKKAVRGVIETIPGGVVTDIKEEIDCLILKLANAGDKNIVIQALALEKAAVDTISVVKPSLLEIFLEKVGEDESEVK